MEHPVRQVQTFEVKAHWDSETEVWWAESDDLVGLVAEAASYDALVVEIRHIAPELLAANLPHVTGEVSLRIVSDQVTPVFA